MLLKFPVRLLRLVILCALTVYVITYLVGAEVSLLQKVKLRAPQVAYAANNRIALTGVAHVAERSRR